MTEQAILLKLSPDSILVNRTIETKRIIEVSLKAPVAVTNKTRTPVNLALVIDRSGSMDGEKLEYVKQAAGHVLDLLNEKDHVSVVAYDDEIETLAQGVRMTRTNRDEVKAAIQRLFPRNMTDLAGGWMRGCQLIADNLNMEEITRCLLLTDGLANRGITDEEELSMHSRELHTRRVSTSCFGVGEGFNEHLLEAMANQGGGKFYYIGKPSEIPAIFAKELSELTSVVAHRVEIKTSLPDGVVAQVPGGWKVERTSSSISIFPGDLYSGQESEFYLKLNVPGEGTKAKITIKVEVSSQGADAPKPVSDELILVYEDDAIVDRAPLDEAMLGRFAVVEVAEAANAALKLERQGRRQEARMTLHQSIDGQEAYLPAASKTLYQDMSERMAHGMEEADRKQSHNQNYQDRKRFNK
jgi:Ca-activated chloride channel family protein